MLSIHLYITKILIIKVNICDPIRAEHHYSNTLKTLWESKAFPVQFVIQW